ncbi:MAG: hypothetical protein RL223_4612 [Pseudomonadota bacterium]
MARSACDTRNLFSRVSQVSVLSPGFPEPATLQWALGALLLLAAACAAAFARTTEPERAALRDWAWACGLGGAAALGALQAGLHPDRGDPASSPIPAVALGLRILLAIALMSLPALAMRAFARVLSVPVRARLLWGCGGLGVLGLLATQWPDAPPRLGPAAAAAASAPMLGWIGLALHSGRPDPRRRPPGRRLLAMAFGGLALGCGMLAAWLLLRGDRLPPTPSPERLLLGAASAVGLLSAGFFFLVQEQRRQRQGDRSRRDGLTGLYTPEAFAERALPTVLSARPYAVLKLEIDDAQQIAQQHGTAGLETVLAHAARQMMQRIRLSDLCCRSDAHGFWLLAPEVSPGQAEQLAHRLVDDATLQRLRVGPERIGYALSVGWACHVGGLYEDEPLTEVIQRAEQALAASRRAHGGAA